MTRSVTFGGVGLGPDAIGSAWDGAASLASGAVDGIGSLAGGAVDAVSSIIPSGR